MTKSIAAILPQIRRLAESAPEPADVYWIVIGDEECYAEYCLECARKIVGWLCEGGEQPKFSEHETYPNFTDMEKEQNYYARDYGGYESDSSCHCEHCGRHLGVILTDYGIEAELDHFENCGITTADDWQYFYDVCYGIKYVESGWFPGDWMKASEVKDARELHRRALKLAYENLRN